MDPVVILILVAALVVIFLVASTVRIVPQARRYNIERFGRYRRTLQPGLNLVLPVADRINTKLDVREQVYSSDPRPVITEDNLVVNIDTVLYYQITDPRAAAYEVADYLQAIDQLTVTTLRNVIGSMDLEGTLTGREEINAQLRAVLDDATGKWGIRVNRVEIKAIDPPTTIKEAMEKQMRAERDKRAAILHAEGERQAKTGLLVGTVAAVHVEATVIEDHYTGEAQTLTTGTESNLLKLGELRGTLTPESARRWAEIKAAHVRAARLGGQDDDPLTHAVAALDLLADRLAAVETAITRAADPRNALANPTARRAKGA